MSEEKILWIIFGVSLLLFLISYLAIPWDEPEDDFNDRWM